LSAVVVALSFVKPDGVAGALLDLSKLRVWFL